MSDWVEIALLSGFCFVVSFLGAYAAEEIHSRRTGRKHRKSNRKQES